MGQLHFFEPSQCTTISHHSFLCDDLNLEFMRSLKLQFSFSYLSHGYSSCLSTIIKIPELAGEHLDRCFSCFIKILGLLIFIETNKL